jgi:uncharacterized OB-fold protein
MTAASPSHPVPVVTDENEVFWTSGGTGHLSVAWCEDCQFFTHPPTGVCRKCRALTGYRAVSGAGTVWSYTVNLVAWQPDLEVPFVLVVVALDEQSDLRLVSVLREIDPDDVTIGMRVQMRFEPRADLFLPYFMPNGVPA